MTRRLWFKRDMKRAILEARKWSTTRTHPLKINTLYTAVSGSRFHARRFAILKITSSYCTTWARVINFSFNTEGFSSPEEMEKWGKKVGLLKGNYLAQEVYYHDFIPYHLNGLPIEI